MCSFCWAFYPASDGQSLAGDRSELAARSVGGHQPLPISAYRLDAGLHRGGVVGSFYAAYSTALVPGTFGPFKALYVQIYAILGGMGFVLLGPMVGAFILTVVPEFLRFAGGIEPIITGALVILIVIFLPQGLLGSLASLATCPRGRHVRSSGCLAAARARRP